MLRERLVLQPRAGVSPCGRSRHSRSVSVLVVCFGSNAASAELEPSIRVYVRCRPGAVIARA